MRNKSFHPQATFKLSVSHELFVAKSNSSTLTLLKSSDSIIVGGCHAFTLYLKKPPQMDDLD